MSDTLEIIALTVGKVIHGINLPFITCTMVRSLKYAIDYGITHMHIGRCHIYFSPENTGSLIKLTFIHPEEEIEVFINAAFIRIAVHAFYSCLCNRAFLFRDSLCTLIINISKSTFDKNTGKVP